MDTSSCQLRWIRWTFLDYGFGRFANFKVPVSLFGDVMVLEPRQEPVDRCMVAVLP